LKVIQRCDRQTIMPSWTRGRRRSQREGRFKREEGEQ
jgi:hypothetical protein